MRLQYTSCTAVLLAALIGLTGCSKSSSKRAPAASTAAGAAAANGGGTLIVSNMQSPRGSHTATAVPQGVVAIGGEAGGAVLSSIEVYKNGSWSAAGKLMTQRKGHSATALSNGRILVAGGQADAQGALVLTTCEIYDPVTQISSPGPTLSVPRSNHVAVAFRNQGRDFVLLAGGVSTGGVSVASAEIFDVSTGRISPLPGKMIQDRVGADAALLPNGNVLIQGGLTGYSASAPTLKPGGAEVFDVATLSFRATANMGIARYNAALARDDAGQAWSVGGNSGVRVEATLESFDAGAGAWSPGSANLSEAREGLSLTGVRGNAVLAVGGTNANVPSAAIDLLTNGVVTPLAPLQQARHGHTATLLSSGRVLIVGGVDAKNALGTSEEYDPFAAPGTKPQVPTAPPATTPILPPPGTTVPGQPPLAGQAPQLLAVLPGKGKPGDIITIAGRNFAQNRQSNIVFFQGGARGKVLYNVRLKKLPLLGTVETLLVEVPQGAQTGDVVVVSQGRISPGKTFTIDLQSGGTPQVLYTLPRKARPGGIVSIFGRNFARPSSANTVRFGGAQGNVMVGITTQSVPFLGNLAVMVAVVPPNGVTGDLTVEAYGKVSAGYAFEVTGTTPSNPGATPSNPGATPSNPGATPSNPSATPSNPSATVFYSEDFEAATVTMNEQGGVWEAARPGASGPTQAASGSWCAGTAMTAGRYAPDAKGYLISREIDLTQATTVELSFNQWIDTDGFDAGRVLVSPDAGSTWYLVRPDGGYAQAAIFTPGEGFTGQSSAWQSTTFDLTAFAGDRIMVAFEFRADNVDERAGWFLDDIVVSGN